MKNIISKHKSFWTKWHLFIEVIIGFLMLIISLIVTFYANKYTASRASNSVTDLLLDNLPVVNMNFIFNEGAVIFITILSAIVLYEPTRISFTVKSIALFLFIRSVFMTLTHLGAPIGMLRIDNGDYIYKMSSGNDLFFSAHTGLPFLLAIIFWNNKYLRSFFLFSTVVGAVSVILGHLHYSIDVASALFIAFGVFHIAKYIFHRDFTYFNQNEKAHA